MTFTLPPAAAAAQEIVLANGATASPLEFSATTQDAAWPNLDSYPRTETAHFLPLDSIRPSPHNPRKRFDAARLEELADMIARQGVLQAIVVRLVEPAKPGGAVHEIVAGERRWRASKLLVARGFAMPHVIPAFIRPLDDFEAREVALTENSGRDDLHPLEEAQAYENLLLHPVGGGEFKPARPKGYTVEQLAERIGHKPNFVFGRLKLLELVPQAKDAFLADTLKLKVAEALARMPAKEQQRALPELLRGWAGEPFSHRQALQHLRDRYMLKLGKAVFAIADAELLPQAGACTACPKRSGANPDLFAAVGTDDMCLDSDCHAAKTQAHGARQLERAREAGQAVLTGAAAKKVLGGSSYHGDYALSNSGHVNLDKPDEELTGSRKTLRTLLGADFGGAVVVKGDDDELPITVAKAADVKAALKSKGLLAPSTKSKPGAPGKKITPEDIKAKRNDRVDALLGKRVPAALAKHFVADGKGGFPGDSTPWLHWLAKTIYDVSYADFEAIQIAATGGPQTGPWLDDLNGEPLARVLMMVVIGAQLADEYQPWKGQFGKPDVADTLAAEIGFDLPALREAVAEEVDSAVRDEIAALAAVVAPGAKPSPTTQPSSPRRRGPTPTKKAAVVASSKTPPPPTSNAAAQGNPSPTAELTPEQALANAVAKEAGVDLATLTAKPSPADKSSPSHRGPRAKSKPPKTEQNDNTAKPPTQAPGHASTLSAEAAWPFPGVNAGGARP